MDYASPLWPKLPERIYVISRRQLSKFGNQSIESHLGLQAFTQLELLYQKILGLLWLDTAHEKDCQPRDFSLTWQDWDMGEKEYPRFSAKR